MKRFLLAAFFAATLPAFANAQLLYTDADITSGSTSSNTSVGAAFLSDTNLDSWFFRGFSATIDDGSAEATDRNFGLGGSVITSGGGSDVAIGELTTTVTGLNTATAHDVFVFFWDDNPGADVSWDIAAGLTSGALTQFDNATTGVSRVDAAFVTANGFSPSLDSMILGDNGDADFTDFLDGNRALFAANVGQVAAGSATLDVFINAGTITDQRTWYDGVGVISIAAVPEPTSAIFLLGVAALGFTRRRR